MQLRTFFKFRYPNHNIRSRRRFQIAKKVARLTRRSNHLDFFAVGGLDMSTEIAMLRNAVITNRQHVGDFISLYLFFDFYLLLFFFFFSLSLSLCLSLSVGARGLNPILCVSC